MAGLSIGQLERIFRRVSTSIEAGLDDRAIWEAEQRNAPASRRPEFATIVRHLTEGESVGHALKQVPGLFPDLACEMIDFGEQGGRQGDVFARLADQYDNLIKLRRTFVAGLVWPILELSFAIVICGMLILVLGWVAQFSNSEPIDIFGFGLSPNGNFMLYCAGVISIGCAIGIPMVGLFQGWFGEAPMAIALKIPVLGSSLQTMALSRMAWTLGMSLDSGMNAIASMNLALRSTKNRFFIRHQKAVRDAIMAGENLSESLKRTGAFPIEFLTTLENGEMTGRVSESMERLSDDYRRRAEGAMRTIAVIGGFLVMLVVMLVIGGTIILLFTKLYLGPINDAARGFQDL